MTEPRQAAPESATPGRETVQGAVERRTGVRELSDRQRHRLVQLACRFVWSRADAEDVVHDALLTAQQKQGQLRTVSKWWSWLCRIVVRQCLLARRNEARRSSHEAAAAAFARAVPRRPEDRSEQRERAELARWAMARMSARQRTAVTLRHLEGMSYERIAEIMEITPSTARGHVRAGREAMREAIARRAPDLGQRTRVNHEEHP